MHHTVHTTQGPQWRGNTEVDQYVQEREVILAGCWGDSPKGRAVNPEICLKEVAREMHHTSPETMPSVWDAQSRQERTKNRPDNQECYSMGVGLH